MGRRSVAAGGQEEDQEFAVEQQEPWLASLIDQPRSRWVQAFDWRNRLCCMDLSSKPLAWEPRDFVDDGFAADFVGISVAALCLLS